MKRKLRIFISHQYPIRLDPDNSGADDEQIQYWEMRVEGRLLDDVNVDLSNMFFSLKVVSSRTQSNTNKANRNENFHHSFEVLSLNWIKICMDRIVISLRLMIECFFNFESTELNCSDSGIEPMQQQRRTVSKFVVQVIKMSNVPF